MLLQNHIVSRKYNVINAFLADKNPVDWNDLLNSLTPSSNCPALIDEIASSYCCCAISLGGVARLFFEAPLGVRHVWVI